MTDYKTIKGKRIKFFTSDLDNEQAEGQIFYQSTAKEFKTAVASAAWASAAPVLTSRRTAASVGTQTANFIAGGFVPPSTQKDSTEEYNGSGWTAGTDLPAASYSAFGAGTLTAGLVYGGSTDPSGQEGITTTLEYDGSSWTSGGALNQKRWSSSSGAGTQTAALCSSGYNDGNITNSEEYNGSSWTAGNAIDTAKRAHGQCGTQTASVLFGGLEPPGSRIATVEEYDGTNYSSATSLPGTRSDMGASGIQTAALGFAGYVDPGRSNNTFLYDGTSWTAQPNLATAIDGGGGSRGGTSTAALSSTGTAPPGLTSATEEFNVTAATITAAAFSSGGNLNSARWASGSAGTQTAGIVFAGRNPPIGQDLALSEEYNGTSWSEGPDLGQARRVNGRGTGTQTAALAHGGHYSSPSTRYKVAEEYDGSSWTNGGTSSNFHDGTMQIGTQTAAASCGGYDGSPMNETEEYNGTSFSSANAMTYSAYMGAGSGPQTAAVVFAGGFPAVNNSNEYDGTNWTAGNTTLRTNYGIGGNGGIGSQTAAIGAGGYTPGPVYFSSAETYDGTSFATAPSLATARSEIMGSGPNSSFFIAGGLTSAGAASNSTEEFTEETTSLNLKTITDS